MKISRPTTKTYRRFTAALCVMTSYFSIAFSSFVLNAFFDAFIEAPARTDEEAAVIIRLLIFSVSSAVGYIVFRLAARQMNMQASVFCGEYEENTAEFSASEAGIADLRREQDCRRNLRVYVKDKAVLFSASLFLLLLINFISAAFSPSADGGSTGGIFVFALRAAGGVLVYPFAEEILYRGLFLHILSDKRDRSALSVAFALIFESFLFAATHKTGTATAFAAGIVLGAAALACPEDGTAGQKRKANRTLLKKYPTICIHSAYNFVLYAALFASSYGVNPKIICISAMAFAAAVFGARVFRLTKRHKI